jgi:hypothetical protein
MTVATSKTLPEEFGGEDLVSRGERWGELRARYIEFPAGVDVTPMMQGLPGDLCPCPHWGYVLEGSIHLRYADGTEEVSRAGELYHWPAPHTAWTEEPVTFVEFSPAEDMERVLDHVKAKLAG